MNGDVGMGCTMRKSWKQLNPFSNAIEDASTIIRNPLSEYVGRDYVHDCSSIHDSIAKGIS